MKKFLFILFIAFFFSTGSSAQVLVPLTICIEEHDQPIGNGYPKSPMRPPVVYIEDYTLTFAADHPEYILNIKDEDGEVLYSMVVTPAETQVTLPSILSGEYVIELTMGNWKFTGYINL